MLNLKKQQCLECPTSGWRWPFLHTILWFMHDNLEKLLLLVSFIIFFRVFILQIIHSLLACLIHKRLFF